MELNFIKMQALGNDYIYVDCFDRTISNPSELAVKMSKRRFSVGADGLVLIERDENADARMRIFNADGSEAETCGNALRCVALLLKTRKNLPSDRLTIATKSGPRRVSALEFCQTQGVFEVQMGKAELLRTEHGNSIISLGNLHCVTMTNDTEKFDFFALDGFNPALYNTEAVEIIGRDTLKMRVYERGSGETFACGSGACAAAACMKMTGRIASDSIRVIMRGGEATVGIDSDYGVTLTGEAHFVFDGVIRL